uniref:Proline-, glutamic acid-and leucine-rich protein 1 n=1 Tax=Zeugodacus cucurbitae TaxID=28588 RepID=A0A0A1WUS9_ZEUCU
MTANDMAKINESTKLFEEIMASEFSYLFMDSLEEYPDIDLKVALEKVISLSMRKSGNYALALRLLNSTSQEVMKKKTCLWTSILLKSYMSCKDSRDANQLIAIIGVLAKSVYTSEDTRKVFGSNSVKNILEIISKEYYTPIDHLAVLRLMVIILKLYPEYSIQCSGIVKNFVSQFMDSANHNIVESTAKCYHHLLSISRYHSNRIVVKDLWQTYQGRLLDTLQTLSDLFLGVSNSSVVEALNCEPLNIPMLQFSNDPIKRIAQVFIRFKNVATYFIVTLREPFSSEKPVNTKKIFGIIKSVLNVAHLFTQRRKTINDIMRNLLLPEFYYILLHILESLIITLRSHLRKNYKQIWMILGDMLNLSTNKIVIEQKKTYMRLRGKIYDVISLWCKIVNQGSRSDLMINFMLKDMQDIYSTLSKIIKTKIYSSGTELETIVHELICSTQRCISQVLNACPNNFKYEIITAIQANFLTAFSGICDVPLWNKYDYEYRADLISTLFSMFTANIYLDLPSAEILINTLCHSPLIDERIKENNKYKLIMLYLESCVHPQKNNLKSSIEIDHIHILAGFPMVEEASIKSKYPIQNSNSSESFAGVISQPEIQCSEAPNLSNNVVIRSNRCVAEDKSEAETKEFISEHVSTDDQLVANIFTTFVDDLY